MPTDYSGALTEFRRFAEQGDTHAQFHLGVMYGLGLGVEQDYRAALDWYQQAARAGHARAQCNLGWMFGTGRGAPQDYVYALAWYSLAAAQGIERARSNRDALSSRMTASQVEQAQSVARQLPLQPASGSDRPAPPGA